ncbi:MAG: hypothetical protein K6E19_06290, partial [Lachnospiraceae bacterium]|nr:hypothetical protein [Lachnospiraceae bacterium]
MEAVSTSDASESHNVPESEYSISTADSAIDRLAENVDAVNKIVADANESVDAVNAILEGKDDEAGFNSEVTGAIEAYGSASSEFESAVSDAKESIDSAKGDIEDTLSKFRESTIEKNIKKVGWKSDLDKKVTYSVAKVDEEGKTVVDENGNPVLEELTKKLHYKLENGNKMSGTGIVIFESNERVVDKQALAEEIAEAKANGTGVKVTVGSSTYDAIEKEIDGNTLTNNKIVTKVVTAYTGASLNVDGASKTKVLEQTWEASARVYETTVRNDNWYSENIILSEYDNDYINDNGSTVTIDHENGESAGFATKIKNAVGIADAENAKTESAQKLAAATLAEKEAKDAEAKVNELLNKLKDITVNGLERNLAELNDDIIKAKEDLKSAKEKRDALKAELESLKSDNKIEKIADLTRPVETVVDPAPTKADDTAIVTASEFIGGEVEVVSENTPEVIVISEPDVAESAPAEASVSENIQETEPVVTEPMQEMNANEETEEKAEEKASETVVPSVEIDDEDSAKAAAPVIVDAEEEEAPLAVYPETEKMNRWWILIILALGTAGADMY